ncbi:MAG TPA: endonuclease III [Candidatus Nanoarchaeia archaeon]|nr:endonuclease III [Candidatus Nanoarchaeia archaeon]
MKNAMIEKIFSLLEPLHQPTMLEQLKDYTPFQLLIATLLSARTRDSTVIPLVKTLFQKYPTPVQLANAKIADLEKEMHGVGFYRVKSKHVKELSKIVVEKYHGKIPQTIEELTSLPGVGRKTANCILNYAFHQPAIAVDIHVHRISNRLGWVKTETPEETEQALQKIVPQRLWSKVNMLLVDHGQRICQPRKPKCGECAVRKWCGYGKLHKIFK